MNDNREESGLFSFSQLPDGLRENVKKLGWEKPMPVQETVIPTLLKGSDVVVQSRTGSGKTGAFLLPVLMGIDQRSQDVQAVVLVPTRELAEQVKGVCAELCQGTGIRYVAVYGGVGYGPQIEAFRNKVQIVIATPGRLIDHLIRGRVFVSNIRYLVFDEGDEMLSMGFYDSIMKILSFVPKRRQTALFSATIPPGVATMAKKFTYEPEHITLSGDITHVQEVDHVYYVAEKMQKDRSLLKIIEMENPEAALIFCNTKAEVEYLGKFLQNLGYNADYISGDLNQRKRDKVMKGIREGSLRFLVATDVAARGIDISELGYVILYDMPQAYDDYVHRSGRTGRAGESGIAISLVSFMEEVDLKRRAEQHKLSLIRRDMPTDEEVERRVADRTRVMLEEQFRDIPLSVKDRLGRFVPLCRELAQDDDEVNVLAMLLYEFYQKTLHKPLYPHESQREEREEKRRPPRGGKPGRSRSRRRR